MSDYVTLIGAEKVQSAAHEMRSAAAEMRRAANEMQGAFEAQQTFLNHWLYRFEAALDKKERGPA